MRAIFFRKVLIKGVTLLFSVLVWGQPSLGCNDWRWDRTCNLKPEFEREYNHFDNVLVPMLSKGESTPISVVSLHLDPHRVYHDPAEPDGFLSLLRLRSVPER